MPDYASIVGEYFDDEEKQDPVASSTETGTPDSQVQPKSSLEAFERELQEATERGEYDPKQNLPYSEQVDTPSPNQQQHLDFIAPINGIEKRETVSANASHNRALWKLLGEHLIKKRNSV